MRALLLLSVTAIWGSTFLIVKDSLNTFDPFVLMTVRFTVATILLFILVKYRKLKPLSFLKYGIATGIVQFLTYAPQTIGLQYTSPSSSAFVTGMFVVFTPIFSFLLFKKRFKVVDYASIVIAIVGLWIVTGGVKGINFGDVITIITAAAIGLVIVLTSDALENGADAIVITFQQLGVTAILSAIFALVLKENLQVQSFVSYLPIMYLAVFGSFYAYVIQNSQLKYINPVIASVILSTEPLFALLFSWIFRYESFNIIKLIGGGLILFAIILPDIFNYLVIKKKNGV